MIGWYVNAGYFPDSTITNLSNMVVTDIHRPFAFLTNIPSFSTTLYAKNENGYRELGAQLNNLLGDQYHFIYGVPDGELTGNDNVPLVSSSMELAYPNLIKKYKETRLLYVSLYFVSLKKIWVKYNGDSHRVYSVSDNGNLSLVGQVNSNQVFNDFTYFDGIPIINGLSFPDYDESKGLPNSNIRGFRTASVSTGIRARTDDFSPGAFKVLDYLFPQGSDPDFEGVIPPDNPYDPGGDSGEGGGGGSFDDSSDQIVDSSLPTLSSANTGFTRIYNPTLSQVQDLAQYLWTDESVIQTIWNHIKQFFENPMEAIIGFNLVPVPVPNGGTKNFALMYIDTGVQMTVAANQFVDQDCGTLEIPLYYGSALDYSPYTKISCFLPFIGMVQLNTDEVMGRTLQVKYRVDICSGSCVAKIFVDGNCLYQYSGHCAINIPISAADFSSYVTASISVAKLAVGAAAAGASGLVAASTVDPTQQTNQVITRTTETTTARNPSTGRQITTGTRSVVETVERPSDVSSTQASFDGLSPSNISNTVGQIMTSKPHVEHSGSFSGNTGYLGIRRPYIVIERPNMCMPSQYQQFNGFPAMITMSLSDCTGFTRIQQVQLTGMEATNPEQSEILQMLKSGVIL